MAAPRMKQPRRKMSHNDLVKMVNDSRQANQGLAKLIQQQDGIARGAGRAARKRLNELNEQTLLLPREKRSLAVFQHILDVISGKVEPPQVFRPCHCCEAEVDCTNTQLPEETPTGQGLIICSNCSPALEDALAKWKVAPDIQRKAINGANTFTLSLEDKQASHDIAHLVRTDLDTLLAALTITIAT
jgi:hypothetical protein